MDFRRISNISVDCVILSFDTLSLNVLLSRRKLHMFDEYHPVIDDWILTGDHVFKSETLDKSALRIFKEATGLDNAYKNQFRTFGNPERIKNERDLLWINSKGGNQLTMSVAYYFLLPADRISLNNENTSWFHIKDLPPLGFDHKQIIEFSLTDLRQKVLAEPMIFELLPDKFTLNQLQAAYEAVLDKDIDNRNFRKKAVHKAYIVPLDEKRTGASKKPSKLYMFSRDIYNRTSKPNQIINI